MYEKNVSFDALVLFLTTGTIPLLGPTIPLLGLFVIFFWSVQRVAIATSIVTS